LEKEIKTMSKLAVFLVVALLLPIVAAGADISGKWKAEFTTPDGTARTNTFTLKADGGKLTGTVAGTQDETPIQNGTINGDEISFTAERPFGKFTYKGKVSGNEIKFKVEFNENSFEMTAKRI
jgi:hypothetical protein